MKKKGCKNLTLLKCTSSYPSKIEESNIITIPIIKKKFKCNVGLSDHTPGIGAAVAAISQGSMVIEKHFTMNKNDKSIDSFSHWNPKNLNR